MPLPVWGTSLPGAKVTVGFETQNKTAIATEKGAWRVVLDPMKAVALSSVNEQPCGLTMSITCEKDGSKAVKEITNLVVDEVWICSGQSNMAGSMRTIIVKQEGGALHPEGLVKPSKLSYFPEDSITSANYPAIRQFVSGGSPQPWLVCSPKTVSGFKKVAYFFGRRVFRDIKIPVGLVVAAKGGSRIETWLCHNEQECCCVTRAVCPLVPSAPVGMIRNHLNKTLGISRFFAICLV